MKNIRDGPKMIPLILGVAFFLNICIKSHADSGLWGPFASYHKKWAAL